VQFIGSTRNMLSAFGPGYTDQRQTNPLQYTEHLQLSRRLFSHYESFSQDIRHHSNHINHKQILFNLATEITELHNLQCAPSHLPRLGGDHHALDARTMRIKQHLRELIPNPDTLEQKTLFRIHTHARHLLESVLAMQTLLEAIIHKKIYHTDSKR